METKRLINEGRDFTRHYIRPFGDNDATFGSLRPRHKPLASKHRKPAGKRFVAAVQLLFTKFSCTGSAELGGFGGYGGAPAPWSVWFDRERAAGLHPAVKDALAICAPHSLRVLVFQCPHISDDGHRVAYTRSHANGMADRQTVTSVGKYLRAHFPQLSDNEIRDIAAKYAVKEDTLGFATTLDEMVEVLRNGPGSCMAHTEADYDSPVHPYAVYRHDLGWALAYQRDLEDSGRYVARALVYQDEDAGIKCFVRSFALGSGDYSHSAHGLEAWLKGMGFVHQGSWPVGTLIARIEHGGRFVAPYIDGGNTCVYSVNGRDDVLRLGGGACFLGEADNTSGLLESNRCTCDDCGERFDEEEMTSVGYSGDRHVCNGCLEDYVYAMGRGGESYWTSADNAERTTDDEWIIPAYADRWDYVRVEDGDSEGNVWAPEGDTYMCDHTGRYYYSDDDLIRIKADKQPGHGCTYYVHEDYIDAFLQKSHHTDLIMQVYKDGVTLHDDTLRVFIDEVASDDIVLDDDDDELEHFANMCNEAGCDNPLQEDEEETACVNRDATPIEID